MAWNGSERRIAGKIGCQRSAKRVVTKNTRVFFFISFFAMFILFVFVLINETLHPIVNTSSSESVSQLITNAINISGNLPATNKQSLIKEEKTKYKYAVTSKDKTTTPKYRRQFTNEMSMAVSKFDCFSHPSEIQLAFLANIPSGTQIIGDYDYDADFMEDLKLALVDKITILPEDDYETVAIKESVIGLKKEIIQLIKNGANIAEILTESRKELQTLGIYKEDLAEHIEEFIQKEDVTDEDAEDFVSAANLLLKEKGIEPLHFSKTTQAILRSNVSVSEHNQEYELEI